MYLVSERTKECMFNLMLDSLHFTFKVPLNEIKVELCQKISFCVYSNLFVNFRDKKISLVFPYDSY